MTHNWTKMRVIQMLLEMDKYVTCSPVIKQYINTEMCNGGESKELLDTTNVVAIIMTTKCVMALDQHHKNVL